MKIIFYGYSGVHSAVVAAAAYLERLPAQGTAQLQLSEVPFFGSLDAQYRLYDHGRDILGNTVYSLGVGSEVELVPRAIKSLLEICHISPHEIMMINTNIPVGPITRLGEYIFCMGLPALGNYLVQKGLSQDFPKLVSYVQSELVRCRGIDLIGGMMDNNGEIIESGESL